jgi:hypothetical protein
MTGIKPVTFFLYRFSDQVTEIFPAQKNAHFLKIPTEYNNYMIFQCL